MPDRDMVRPRLLRRALGGHRWLFCRAGRPRPQELGEGPAEEISGKAGRSNAPRSKSTSSCAVSCSTSCPKAFRRSALRVSERQKPKAPGSDQIAVGPSRWQSARSTKAASRPLNRTPLSTSWRSLNPCGKALPTPAGAAMIVPLAPPHLRFCFACLGNPSQRRPGFSASPIARFHTAVRPLANPSAPKPGQTQPLLTFPDRDYSQPFLKAAAAAST